MTSLMNSESQRLVVLHKLHILDTPTNPAIDGIVKAAAQLCDAPIALVTLLDEQRQWFKANHGLTGVAETSRRIAFCDHTIRDDRVMVIEDARRDSRFKENPLVTGQIGLRFYAGAPLESPSGEYLGALCVLDRKPKSLEPGQIDALSRLATVVVDLLCVEARELESLATQEQHSGARGTADLILEHARSALLSDGIDSFSVRKVAHLANISVGNLQYHFASKRALLHALADSFGPALEHYYQSRLAPIINPVDRMVAYVRHVFAGLPMEPSPLLLNMFWVLAVHDQAIAGKLTALNIEKEKLIANALVEANADLETAEAHLRASTLVSLLSGAFLHSPALASGLSNETFENNVLERVVRLPHQPIL